MSNNEIRITEYYELVALHRALMAARFARDPPDPVLPGSPYLADIANRIAQALSDLEIERGKAERAKDWQMKIVVGSEVWDIAVRNAATAPDLWKQRTHEEKKKIALTYLSPSVNSDEIVEEFVHHVNEKTNE